ncbi:MAG: hypothetical protein U0570_12470 [Phycisphaerales bacterium]
MTLWDDDGPGPHQPKLVIAGSFSGIGGVSFSNIAAWDGREWSSIGGGTNSLVGAVLGLSDGRLVAAGNFTLAGGVVCNHIAIWNGTSWAPAGSGLSGSVAPVNFQVNALAERANGEIIAAGGFTTAGGLPAANIARWDGSNWSPLGTGISRGTLAYSWISCLFALPTGELLAGGMFGDAGGVPVKSLAVWDGGHWSGFADGVDGTIWSVARAPNGLMYFGGSFSANTIESFPRGQNAVAWDGTNWLKLGAGVSGSAGLSPVRDACVMKSGDVVFGGDLSSAGGANTSSIALWNSAQWSGLANGLPRAVQRTVVLPSGELIVGRDNTSGGPWTTQLLFRWGSAQTAWIARQPEARSAACGGSTSFSASLARGYQAESVVWKRGAKVLAHDPGAGVRIEYADGVCTLRLDNVHEADAGMYSCVFDFGCNQVTTDPAQLAVQGACCPGDFNLDGVVDDADFGVFVVAYNLLLCNDAQMVPGCAPDLDHSSAVDDADFSLFIAAYDALTCTPAR